MDLIPFGFDPSSKMNFPKVDVKETNSDVVVVADIPGLEPKKISVEISATAIKFSGEVHEETESKGKNYVRKERTSHSFERVIPLPCAVMHDKAKAVAKNGILTITLPKQTPEAPKMRKIPIEEE